MVRTSAPTVMGNRRLADNIKPGVIPTKLDAEMNDADVGPGGPDMPVLGTTLKTYDLNGELVRENLADIETGNDNVAMIAELNKDIVS